MATISDRARDFWERISPRERGLVVLLLVATPLTLALWLGLEIHDGLGAMAAHNDKTRHALDVLADMRARGSAAPQAPVDDVVKNMPVDSLSLDTYVNKAAQKAGFTIRGTRPHAAVTHNGFVTSTLSFDVDPLSIDDLKTFMQAIETDSKYVAITHLTIRKNHGKPDKVDAAMDVATYATEKKSDDSGSGGSAGSSGSSGTGGSAKGG